MKKTKKEIQSEIVNNLIMSPSINNLVIAATGVGKSKIAIDYLKTFFVKKKANILIVVPTIELRDIDWPNELKKWNTTNTMLKNIKIKCYASLTKIKDMTFDLVIFDEIHRTTEFNSIVFENNIIKHALGLTATFPKDPMKQYLLKVYNFNNIANIPLDEAVKLGLISPYEIKIIPVWLNNTIKDIPAGNSSKRFYVTERGQYDYITNTIDILKEKIDNSVYCNHYDVQKLKFLRLMRARFLSNLNSKIIVGKETLFKIDQKNERTLIFANSIATAEAMHFHTYHSGKKSKEKGLHLQKFRNSEINTLACVNGLNEGVNISDVDNAIIMQVNASDLILTQRIGRTLRLKEGKDCLSKIFILCAQNTIDEDWVNSVTKNLNVICD